MSEAVTVTPSGPVEGAIAAPASKSVTNRMLVAAALADGGSVLAHPLQSEDATAMCGLVTAFGARVAGDRDAWTVDGTCGRLAVPDAPVDVGLSGTTMRFGAALAALAPGPSTLTGAPPLLRRPVGPLVEALARLGADVTTVDGLPPLHSSGGGLDGGEVTVGVTRSSQFASALLLVAPYARAPVTVRLAGPAADAYIQLSVAVVRAFGGKIDQIEPRAWLVTPGIYRSGRHEVEYDASSAAHLLALAVATGGRITVTNVAEDTLQPDAAITEVFEAMGASVTRDGSAVTVIGPERPAAVDVDLAAMPDQVTTVAALAALADGTSTIRGVAVARTHETDRLAALARELGALGVRVDEASDGLRVHGGSATGPARLTTYDDHRLAMAFALLAARVPGVVIADPGCVAKTYPGFWEDVHALGVSWQEVRS